MQNKFSINDVLLQASNLKKTTNTAAFLDKPSNLFRLREWFAVTALQLLCCNNIHRNNCGNINVEEYTWKKSYDCEYL